jgi:hypothetical protein
MWQLSGCWSADSLTKSNSNLVCQRISNGRDKQEWNWSCVLLRTTAIGRVGFWMYAFVKSLAVQGANRALAACSPGPVDVVSLEQVFHQVTMFYPPTVIPLMTFVAATCQQQITNFNFPTQVAVWYRRSCLCVCYWQMLASLENSYGSDLFKRSIIDWHYLERHSKLSNTAARLCDSL